MLYQYGSAASGLQFTIDAVANGSGTSFNVQVLVGSLNLNAVYWGDGDNTANESHFDGVFANSDNINGANVLWNDNGTSTSKNEVYDGGKKLSDAGLGHGTDLFLSATGKSTYQFDVPNLDLTKFPVLGVRATSTSTAEGSIKWADDHSVPHAGNFLFVENFDGYIQFGTFDPTGQFGTVNLGAANGWTGDGGHSELGLDNYGGIHVTSGGAAGFWLDTQNSPGGIDISHTFVDPTGGQAQLSFDIGVQSLDYLGTHYQTDPQAKIEFRIDGTSVKTLTYAQVLAAAGNVDQLAHIEAVFNTGAPNSVHTLEIVDLTPTAGFTGFSVDSIHINDWV